MADEPIKAGNRNNQDDRERIRKMRDLSRQIHDITMEMEPDDNDQPPAPANFTKAEGGAGDDIIALSISIIGAVKAAGEWQLEVLGVPFGGPHNGKDRHGEYFSQKTNLYLDKIKSTLAVYYHGYTPEGQPAGEPVIIGDIKSNEKRADGWWFTVILDKASEFAARVWEAAKAGTARASSGSIAHLVRIAKDGEILSWPLAELSIFDTEGQRQPANAYAVALPVIKARGIIPEFTGDNVPVPPEGGDTDKPTTNQPQSRGVLEMDEKELLDLLDKRDAAKAEAARKVAEADEVEKLRKENEALKADAAKARRLPDAPVIARFSDQWAFDNLDAGDQAALVGVLEAAKKTGRSAGASEGALKALATKLESDKSRVGEMGRQAMKMAGVKADEVGYSTLASYGDEWVGIAYSQAIWDAIRTGTFVANRLPSVEVPRGTESMYLPLESTDPVFYKVAENTTYNSTMLTPVPTVTASRLGTARVQLTLSKMGARVLWSGELEERSLVPFVSQLRMQLAVSGAEYLESAIIDGDTVTTATTNINDIASTAAQGGTEHYLLFNGFRKSPLVTTTANSRSAAGLLDVTDYLETVKLMGGAGINALDTSKVSFIIDPLTHYKSLTLPEIRTRDVFSAPAIEGGRLTGLWGYGINVSGQMNKSATNRLSNSAGKVDQDTVGNNLYGSILAVRWDQWKLGYQRRMTLEVDRYAASDTNEIVAQMVVGLIQRDTEASAITYYVGV